jgi:hypothetical protein
MNPTSVEDWKTLETLLWNARRLAEEPAVTEKIVQLQPNVELNYESWAIALANTQQYEAEVRVLRKAVSIFGATHRLPKLLDDARGLCRSHPEARPSDNRNKSDCP